MTRKPKIITWKIPKILSTLLQMSVYNKYIYIYLNELSFVPTITYQKKIKGPKYEWPKNKFNIIFRGPR